MEFARGLWVDAAGAARGPARLEPAALGHLSGRSDVVTVVDVPGTGFAIGWFRENQADGPRNWSSFMPTSRPKRSPRTRRRPEVRQRLERSRDRVRARRQQARQREQRITAAVKQYVTAWEAITVCEATRDGEVEALRQQITRVHQRAAEQIAAHRAQQALAAAAIRDQGQTDDDVAELLEISAKQARQLITAARANTDSDVGAQQASKSADAAVPAPDLRAGTPPRPSPSVVPEAGSEDAASDERQEAP
ncbi:hypothetical protein [Nocardia sp. NPDC050793]|uniref:hypothetical protein n=1 Tax=Nocardia sp. NPDC050793 TaxID=3155159 RepID=UPI0033DAC613